MFVDNREPCMCVGNREPVDICLRKTESLYVYVCGKQRASRYVWVENREPVYICMRKKESIYMSMVCTNVNLRRAGARQQHFRNLGLLGKVVER